MPVLTAGFFIWFLTSFLLGLVVELLYFIISYLFLPLIIFYFALWPVTYYLSINKCNLSAMIFFFSSCFITGFLTAPTLMVVSLRLGAEIAIYLFIMSTIIGLGTTTGLMLLGMRLGEKISEKWGYPLVFFGLELLILEFGCFFFLGSNIILSIVLAIVNVLVLAWIFGVIIWDGSRLTENILEGKWMESVVDIFLDLINVIIRVLELLVEILDAFA